MKFIDRLAAIEHRQWMQWAEKILAEENISRERRERWEKMFCDYDELPEEWKEYDREWARNILREVRLQLEEEHLAFYASFE